MASTLIYITAAVASGGAVLVRLVLAWRCPKDKIPELARWLGRK